MATASGGVRELSGVRLRELAVLITVYFIYILIKDNPENNIIISRNVNVDSVFLFVADETMKTSL